LEAGRHEAPRQVPARALQSAGQAAEARSLTTERSIESLAAEDEQPVMRVFSDFEALLGPVGAAKALHVLAPRFFPL
jgi:hypothetical protein